MLPEGASSTWLKWEQRKIEKKKIQHIPFVPVAAWGLLAFLSVILFNLYAEYIMRNTGLREAQAGIKIAGRNINNFRYADDTTL